jgi:hypothetical protein
MELHLVQVKNFNSSFDANLALAKLNDNGIEAVIHNNETILINPGRMNSANIKLMVKEEDVEKAAALLADFD